MYFTGRKLPYNISISEKDKILIIVLIPANLPLEWKFLEKKNIKSSRSLWNSKCWFMVRKKGVENVQAGHNLIKLLSAQYD